MSNLGFLIPAAASMLSACAISSGSVPDAGSQGGGSVGSPDAGGATDADADASGATGRVLGWAARAPIAGGARQECGVAALGRRIYVIGGFTADGIITAAVEAFEVDRNAWVPVAPLPRPLHHVNVAAVGGRLYVLGAFSGDDFAPASVFFSYDPVSNRWTPQAPMPTGSERGASGVAVIGTRIYVAGGIRGGSVDDFSAYDTSRDSWETLPRMPGPRDHLGAAAVGSTFYAVGGRQDGALRGRVDRYDTPSRTWTTAAAMLTARAGIAVSAAGDRVFAMGGEGNPYSPTGVFAQNEEYDPAADRWTSREPMPTPRHGTGAAIVDGTLFVPGGATVQNFGASAVNEAYTP